MCTATPFKLTLQAASNEVKDVNASAHVNKVVQFTFCSTKTQNNAFPNY